MDQHLLTLSNQLAQTLIESQLTVSTAESCTGGLLSHVLTSVSGSSHYFTGGVIAYSNDIKEKVLSVPKATLVNHGAVCQNTALAMANGIRQKFHTDIGLSTTGIAGPTGGTPEKPIGLVWIGISTSEDTVAYENYFSGERDAIKHQTVSVVLSILLGLIKPE